MIIKIIKEKADKLIQYLNSLSIDYSTNENDFNHISFDIEVYNATTESNIYNFISKLVE